MVDADSARAGYGHPLSVQLSHLHLRSLRYNEFVHLKAAELVRLPFLRLNEHIGCFESGSNLMFSSLSQWVIGVVSPPRRSHDETQGEAQEEIPPPPFLPAERAHQLEIQDQDHSFDSTATSAFFQRLPSDSRRLVLIEAFGERIVHADLRLMRLGRSLEGHEHVHGCEPESFFRKAGKALPLFSSVAPPQWRWYGCVCHREPEIRVRNRSIMNRSLSPPWYDLCLNTEGGDSPEERRRVCEEWSGQEPLKCRVGAMGWLRTCRQA